MNSCKQNKLQHPEILLERCSQGKFSGSTSSPESARRKSGFFLPAYSGSSCCSNFTSPSIPRQPAHLLSQQELKPQLQLLPPEIMFHRVYAGTVPGNNHRTIFSSEQFVPSYLTIWHIHRGCLCCKVTTTSANDRSGSLVYKRLSFFNNCLEGM